MNLLSEDLRIFKFRFSFAALLWFLLAIIGVILKIRLGYDKIGNFLIFRNAFWHMLHQTNLYQIYPSEHLGSYLYGPLFSIVIAPFALLPVAAGAFFWTVANATILFFAIRNLPVSYKNQNILLLISAIEMMTSVQNMQINCIVAALIILSYIFVKKEQQDFWAALFIAIGFLIKLYGIVGIVFFLFSNHKLRFIRYFLLWTLILFCLPMLLSSPPFIVQSYFDWYHTLIIKNNVNTLSVMQNISVMGMLRHIFKTDNLNLLVIFIAAWFYLIPLLRLAQLKNKIFQLSYLSLALIGVVIFSSSSESPTYIIAVTGVGIWFGLERQKQWIVIILLIFTLCFTSLSSTDLFPHFIKMKLIQPYSLKALPCFITWLVIAYQLIRKDFNKMKIEVK
jgi:hypothetical protein